MKYLYIGKHKDYLDAIKKNKLEGKENHYCELEELPFLVDSYQRQGIKFKLILI